MLKTVFCNSSWKFSYAVAYPNRLCRLDHDGAIIGAVVVLRGRGTDFALGVAGLDYLVAAENEGRITKGHVVLAHEVNGRPEFIAAEEAQTVYGRLREYPPRDGKLGPYWWITAEFMPASTMVLDLNAPF